MEKRYKVTVHLQNGDVIDAMVTARDEKHAKERLQSKFKLEPMVTLLRGNPVKKIETTFAGYEKLVNPEKYLLRKSNTRPGWMVCTDTEHRIVVEYKQGSFNESQKVTLLDDVTVENQMDLARWLREMGDWITEQSK